MVKLSADDFHAISGPTELAQRLNIDHKALSYVILASPVRECKRIACIFPQVESNYGLCLCCSQSWFPSVLPNRDGVERQERGYLLLDPSLRNKVPGTQLSRRTCCCENKVCYGIGYTDSIFYMPEDHEVRRQWYHALGLSQVKRATIDKKPRVHSINFWHFSPQHLECNGTLWKIKKADVYTDSDKKVWFTPNRPPPNYSVNKFIADNYNSRSLPSLRWMDEHRAPPSWWKTMKRKSSPTKKRPASTVEQQPIHLSEAATPPPVSKRQVTPHHHDLMIHRAVSFASDKTELEEQLSDAFANISLKEQEIAELKNKLELIQAALTEHQEKLIETSGKVAQHEEELDRLKRNIHKDRYLKYDDLRSEGLLGKNVKDFTFFDDFDSNDAFLEAINYADGSDGCLPPDDGMCEGLLRYTSLRMNDRARLKEDPAATVGSQSPLGKRRKRKCSFKTDWLIYNVYVHSGWTLNQIAPLFGVGASYIHNVLYSWSNLLSDVLSAWFPVPTRSHMLAAYPIQIFRKFGHCLIHTLIDATEVNTDSATRLKIYSILYSCYKSHATLKFLIGCDGIGTTWDEAISDGFGGSISDPVVTRITRILETIPFGSLGEVDKAFLCENDAINQGVGLVRPMKMLDNQVQQSAADTALTQKVGNTRIAIEQLNGAAKAACNYLDHNVPILQLGLAPLIVKVVYLMQNFRPGWVQGRRKTDDDKLLGRPCKAEVRWYGATEDGLFDARKFPWLWATQSELKRWKELRVERPLLDDISISELVLQENIPDHLRNEIKNIK
jgi:hypothetical protein